MDAGEYLTIFYVKMCEQKGQKPTVQPYFEARYRDGKKSARTQMYRRVREQFVLAKDDEGRTVLSARFKEPRILNQLVEGEGKLTSLTWPLPLPS